MQLKIKVLKFIKYLHMNYVLIIAILSSNIILSQVNNTINNERNKIDGVAAVVEIFLYLILILKNNLINLKPLEFLQMI